MISTKPLHTFQLDSYAKQQVCIRNEQDLKRLLLLTEPFVILGQGSNTVFLEDFEGCVVQNALLGIEVDETKEHFLLKVKSGENWHQLVTSCLAQQIYGFENLALIPGTVGAAPIQNIGAYGVEIERFIQQVDYFDITDGQTKSLSRQQCQFGYRDSIFKRALKNKVFITQVHFQIPKQWHAECSYAPLNVLDKPDAQQIFDIVCATRKQKLPDPTTLGNSGSFFKNPIVPVQVAQEMLADYPTMPCYNVSPELQKLAAGWLIEQAGLKGFVYQNVAVHNAQALVLVNKTGLATGHELRQLIHLVQQKVFEKFAIQLEPEVQLIGKHGELVIEG